MLVVLSILAYQVAHALQEFKQAVDAHMALSIYLQYESEIDVLLTDVVMPGMNGFQATRQISKNTETSSIPVIMVTTKDQETDKVWAMRQGAKDYIVKPVQEKALIEHVNMVLSA